ncbi:hypothetical protein [Actinokineospora sp.]|uniref:hypothetical protein n=1 Tax=Actinokineospora sp. TaxID=1872133 RepID=UPI003D6A1C10
MKLRGSAAGSTPDGRPLITIWFHFDWTFADGGQAPFEVVDVMELDEDEKITKLHIIYDTVEVRPAFEHSVGRVSWRPGLSPLV